MTLLIQGNHSFDVIFFLIMQADLKQYSRPISKLQLQFGIFNIIIMTARAIFFISVLIPLFVIQHFLIPLIIFNKIKRYVSCVLNLICCRLLLLTLWFFKFQCQNYKFFDRNSTKFLLRSGYVGVGLHKNIVDFLYYSYLMNPIFTKIVVHKISQQEQKIYYSPLTYMDAWKAALSYRGFEPIIVRSAEQLRKLKCRKMALKTLASQSFEQLLGPILILLPGVHPEYNIAIQKQIVEDIYDHQVRFARSLVGFNFLFQKKPIFEEVYMNQSHFLLRLMSTISINKLTITALTFRKYKNQYTRTTYAEFVNKLYMKGSIMPAQISYSKYVQTLQQIEQQMKKQQEKQIAYENQQNPGYIKLQ